MLTRVVALALSLSFKHCFCSSDLLLFGCFSTISLSSLHEAELPHGQSDCSLYCIPHNPYDWLLGGESCYVPQYWWKEQHTVIFLSFAVTHTVFEGPEWGKLPKCNNTGKGDSFGHYIRNMFCTTFELPLSCDIFASFCNIWFCGLFISLLAREGFRQLNYIIVSLER